MLHAWRCLFDDAADAGGANATSNGARGGGGGGANDRASDARGGNGGDGGSRAASSGDASSTLLASAAAIGAQMLTRPFAGSNSSSNNSGGVGSSSVGSSVGGGGAARLDASSLDALRFAGGGDVGVGVVDIGELGGRADDTRMLSRAAAALVAVSIVIESKKCNPRRRSKGTLSSESPARAILVGSMHGHSAPVSLFFLLSFFFFVFSMLFVDSCRLCVARVVDHRLWRRERQYHRLVLAFVLV